MTTVVILTMGVVQTTRSQTDKYKVTWGLDEICTDTNVDNRQ